MTKATDLRAGDILVNTRRIEKIVRYEEPNANGDTMEIHFFDLISKKSSFFRCWDEVRFWQVKKGNNQN